jgi:hypothetical protein
MLHSRVDSYSWEWREHRQSLVHTVPSMCCTQCMLYSVDAVLGVCCNWYPLMNMALRHNKGWHVFVFCNHDRVVDENVRDGGWRWDWCAWYQQIWEIRGITWLTGLGRPHITVVTRQIRTFICRHWDGKFCCTWISVKSQFCMMRCLISCHLSVSSPQFYRNLATQSNAILLCLSMSE